VRVEADVDLNPAALPPVRDVDCHDDAVAFLEYLL
jgi:hypothetical protein